MDPKNYNNLVPDSPLHRHLESLLDKNKGRVPVEKVCAKVLLVRDLDRPSASAMVATFLNNDPRFHLNGDGTVEWAPVAPEEVWNSHRRLAVFDLETNSDGQEIPRIMEVGFSLVEDGRIIEEWSSLVNPRRSIPHYVRRLTGITNAAVRKAPLWEDILPRVLETLSGTILVAHQAKFDYDCLNLEISRILELRLLNPYLCTVEMSRTLLPDCESYRLETLSQSLGLRHEQPHRAGSDAHATAELLCHLFNTVKANWSEYLRPLPPHERYARAEAKAKAKTEVNAEAEAD